LFSNPAYLLSILFPSACVCPTAQAASFSQQTDWLNSSSFKSAPGYSCKLLNGYPYGAFHGTQVKADVFAPDWRTEERVAYTCVWCSCLQAVLPKGRTAASPQSHFPKPWIQATDRARRDWKWCQPGSVAAALVRPIVCGQKIRLETSRNRTA